MSHCTRPPARSVVARRAEQLSDRTVIQSELKFLNDLLEIAPHTCQLARTQIHLLYRLTHLPARLVDPCDLRRDRLRSRRQF